MMAKPNPQGINQYKVRGNKNPEANAALVDAGIDKNLAKPAAAIPAKE
jgi:hypothetical protein